jgi:hypothetical protein
MGWILISCTESCRSAASGYCGGLTIQEEAKWYGKKPMAVQAWSLLCYYATREVGISATELAIRLGLSQSAVWQAVGKGWQIR